MTDSELLQAAAKAAEIDAEFHSELGTPEFQALRDGMFLKGKRSPDNSKYWNPLTSDADALRLAVWLRINMNIGSEGIFVSRYFDELVIAEKFKGDPCEITRRAIVKFAAAIGEATK